MKKELPDIKKTNDLVHTNININVNMDNCEYLQTKTKMVTVSLDVRNGFEAQVQTNTQQAKRITKRYE